MRKGFTLMEMLAVIVLLGVFLIVLAPVFNALVGEIPRSFRVVQANTSLLNMLERMGRDIDAAQGLPELFADQASDDEQLLIEGVDGVVCYQLRDDQVVRRALTEGGAEADEGATVWSVPSAKIEWRVWRENRKGYAVEVRTHIEHYVRGKMQKKMANSHLYFVGAFQEVPR